MDMGMLWFDDSSRPLPEKVQRAAAYYAEKYGQAPTLCLVNPAGLNGREGAAGKVQIRAARSVMLHHLWVGVDEDGKGGHSARASAGEGGARRTKRSAKKTTAKKPTAKKPAGARRRKKAA